MTSLSFAYSVKRVISVLPSATEILCLFPGAANLLVGRSHECDHPAQITDRPILTGQKTTFTTSADVDRQVSEALSTGASLYTLDIARIHTLQPDLILTQDICDVCAIDLQTVQRVAASMHPQPQVVTLNPASLHDVLHNIKDVGRAIGAPDSVIDHVYAAFLHRMRSVGARPRPNPVRTNVAFIEWIDPIFFGGHWTPQLIELAGGYHPLNSTLASPLADVVSMDTWAQKYAYGESPYTKSYRIEGEKLAASKPDLLLIAPCGLDIPTTKRELKALVLNPNSWWWMLDPRPSRVVLVDGNHMFNRPGPRLVDAAEFVQSLLYWPDEVQRKYVGGRFPFEELDLGVWFDADKVKEVQVE
ncbi:hypothetical protein BCR44DRAFT_1482457 [Catenaria anguillulae PL171]|uniref:Fe/B12 periplasmic-binding domain-containing protein n=1 Tax=Catenaria anguillulae PL171 TaxID=765915 RepID=A0A1Y2HZ51_9FUNG|nr:hypothetical protein BCR44DRAFT_1482457 [Catenaria anguillulae PL171]